MKLVRQVLQELSVYDTSEKERLERVAAAEAEVSGSSVEKNE